MLQNKSRAIGVPTYIYSDAPQGETACRVCRLVTHLVLVSARTSSPMRIPAIQADASGETSVISPGGTQHRMRTDSEGLVSSSYLKCYVNSHLPNKRTPLMEVQNVQMNSAKQGIVGLAKAAASSAKNAAKIQESARKQRESASAAKARLPVVEISNYRLSKSFSKFAQHHISLTVNGEQFAAWRR